MDAVVVPPQHLGHVPVARPGTAPGDREPLLLALLASGGAVAAWASGARGGPWSAALAVAVLAVSAEVARRRDPRPCPPGMQLARAVLTLAAAAVAVGAHPGPAPLALAWLPAACALYAFVLAPRAAAVVTLGGLAVLTVLAAGAGAGGSRPPAAFAACAMCVVAAGLAAGTLRGVLESAADAPPVAAPAVTGPPVTAPPVTAPPAAAAPVPGPAVRPAGVPGADVLLEATARAQARSGVVGGGVGLLVVTLTGLDGLPAAVGRAQAQAAVDALARRARAWLPAGDVVAWLGAGRLAVLLEGVDPQTCLVVARRLGALLTEPVEAGGHVLSLSATVAVTLADDAHETPQALLHRAETAPALPASELVPVPSPRPTGPADPDAAADPLVDELWRALATGGIRVALQPIVALGAIARHDRVVAVEALARWDRADGVAVPPARFVTAARRAGLADLLGAAVLAQGLDALVERRRAGEPGLGLAVNVAPEQLVGPAVAAGMLQALEARGLDAGALTVELPAAAPLHDPAALATLQALREAGVGVVLDNFGSTGLSLAALRDLPLTGLKLDRSLVADLGGDDRLVVATLRLATRLGLACTAVGVETPRQLEAARALGVDGAQGHLLGRPEGVSAVPAGTPAGAPAGAPSEPAAGTTVPVLLAGT